MSNLQVFVEAIRIHSITVVLGGNINTTAGQFTNRVITASMTKLQFESFGTKSTGDELVA